MVNKVFNETSSGIATKNKNRLDQQLAEELYKPIIKKFKKRKVQLPFIDNIWSAELAEVQLITNLIK